MPHGNGCECVLNVMNARHGELNCAEGAALVENFKRSTAETIKDRSTGRVVKRRCGCSIAYSEGNYLAGESVSQFGKPLDLSVDYKMSAFR